MKCTLLPHLDLTLALDFLKTQIHLWDLLTRISHTEVGTPTVQWMISTIPTMLNFGSQLTLILFLWLRNMTLIHSWGHQIRPSLTEEERHTDLWMIFMILMTHSYGNLLPQQRVLSKLNLTLFVLRSVAKLGTPTLTLKQVGQKLGTIR